MPFMERPLSCRVLTHTCRFSSFCTLIIGLGKCLGRFSFAAHKCMILYIEWSKGECNTVESHYGEVVLLYIGWCIRKCHLYREILYSEFPLQFPYFFYIPHFDLYLAIRFLSPCDYLHSSCTRCRRVIPSAMSTVRSVTSSSERPALAR